MVALLLPVPKIITMSINKYKENLFDILIKKKKKKLKLDFHVMNCKIITISFEKLILSPRQFPLSHRNQDLSRARNGHVACKHFRK